MQRATWRFSCSPRGPSFAGSAGSCSNLSHPCTVDSRGIVDEMGNGRIKVAFFVPALTGGGAERVVTRILRHLDRSKFHPLLVVMEKGGIFLEDVPPDVNVRDCGKRILGRQAERIFLFAKILKEEKPDVVVSFLWFANAVAVMGCRLSGGNARLVLSERSTILGSREGFLQELCRRLAIRFLYPAADRIVVNSESLRSQLLGHFRFPESKVDVIHNPLDIHEVQARSMMDDPPALPAVVQEPIVIGMGRFSQEKGFDLLVRAMAIVKFPARLVLLGEGREERNLRRLAESLGLSRRVGFPGFRKPPYGILRQATVFVLPSRYEGFPNGLVEAMALGVPCVATRCRTGPEEIIRDGENGLLVPVEDPGSLAMAIDRLLGDATLRERMGGAARDSARRYDAPGIVRQFEEMISGVVACPR